MSFPEHDGYSSESGRNGKEKKNISSVQKQAVAKSAKYNTIINVDEEDCPYSIVSGKKSPSSDVYSQDDFQEVRVLGERGGKSHLSDLLKTSKFTKTIDSSSIDDLVMKYWEEQSEVKRKKELESQKFLDSSQSSLVSCEFISDSDASQKPPSSHKNSVSSHKNGKQSVKEDKHCNKSYMPDSEMFSSKDKKVSHMFETSVDSDDESHTGSSVYKDFRFDKKSSFSSQAFDKDSEFVKNFDDIVRKNLKTNVIEPISLIHSPLVPSMKKNGTRHEESEVGNTTIVQSDIPPEVLLLRQTQNIKGKDYKLSCDLSKDRMGLITKKQSSNNLGDDSSLRSAFAKLDNVPKLISNTSTPELQSLLLNQKHLQPFSRNDSTGSNSSTNATYGSASVLNYNPSSCSASDAFRSRFAMGGGSSRFTTPASSGRFSSSVATSGNNPLLASRVSGVQKAILERRQRAHQHVTRNSSNMFSIDGIYVFFLNNV